LLKSLSATYRNPCPGISETRNFVGRRRGSPVWSRRSPAFGRTKRSASHRQQMEAERCATANTSDLHYIFSHPLTLQYEWDAVSGKRQISTFLALPPQRNLHTGAGNDGVF